MNTVWHYTEMMAFDATGALAEALKGSLEKGLLVNHPMMMAIVVQPQQTILDPISKKPVMFQQAGIYSRVRNGDLMSGGFGAWSQIAGLGDIDAVAHYLAGKTPPSERYSMMCSILESSVVTKAAKKAEEAMAPTF